MSTIIDAETRAAEKVKTIIVSPEPNKNTVVAISFRATFAQIAKIADLSIPLRRPRKVSPSTNDDLLRDELEAWDAASDEAHQSFEDSLGEE